MADHPLRDRLDVFREMAAEARRDEANASSEEMRRGYAYLANSWEQLICEIEATTITEPHKR
jgi:Ribonuclease G/E